MGFGPTVMALQSCKWLYNDIYIYNFSCNSYNSIYSWAPAVDCWILIWGCLNKRYTTKWPSKNRDKYDEAMNVGSQFGSYMNSGF